MKKKIKMTLSRITLAQLRSFRPCYDPIKHLPEEFNGTVVDLLKHKTIPAKDKLWAVCREEFLSASLLRRFAVAQAMTCRKRVKDKKMFDGVLEVCIKFSWGKATKAELSAAASAAWSAAYSAAYSAAWSAAAYAAGSAARFAAGYAAESVAESAAGSAAGYAAESAAAYAAGSAACRMILRMILKEYTAPKRTKKDSK